MPLVFHCDFLVDIASSCVTSVQLYCISIVTSCDYQLYSCNSDVTSSFLYIISGVCACARVCYVSAYVRMCMCVSVALYLRLCCLSHAVHMQSNLMAMELTYLLSNAAPQYEEYSTGVLWEGVGVTGGVVWGIQHRCGCCMVCCRGCTIIVMYTICTQVCSQCI